MSLSSGLGNRPTSSLYMDRSMAPFACMSRNQLGRQVVPMIRASTSSWLRMRWASAAGSPPAVNDFRKWPKHQPVNPSSVAISYQ